MVPALTKWWPSLALMVASVQANHPHHHHQHVPLSSGSSSFGHQFSYSLPGGHVYMSRTFSSSSSQPHHHPSSPISSHRDGRVFQSHHHHHQEPSSYNLNHSSGIAKPPQPLYQRHQVEPPKEEKYSPFNPRYQISRVEVSDDEWEEAMEEVFSSSGILKSEGGILTRVPRGLVNINFDTHACVHMGTDLRSVTCSEKPTSVSYPIDLDNEQEFSLVMLDLDHEASPYLHWMVTNIPGTKVDLGETITHYQSPIPNRGSGTHRYVILVMEQTKGKVHIPREESYASTTSCDNKGRAKFNLSTFKAKFGLADAEVAANYFKVAHDDSVNDIQGSCHF